MMDNKTRKGLKEAFEQNSEPTDKWVNYGDASPDKHGGLFVRYDPDSRDFDFVQTIPACDVDFEVESFNPGEQYVKMVPFDWHEIVTESGEWTGSMERVVESLHRANKDPIGAIVDNRLLWLVAGYGRDYGTITYRKRDSYEKVLESVGIANYEG